jgi:hypothetical protein
MSKATATTAQTGQRRFQSTWIYRVWRFYVDGFKSMTTGRWLWAIILVKLFVLFVIIRWIFFPNFLNVFKSDSAKSQYVGTELVHRAAQ